VSRSRVLDKPVRIALSIALILLSGADVSVRAQEVDAPSAAAAVVPVSDSIRGPYDQARILLDSLRWSSDSLRALEKKLLDDPGPSVIVSRLADSWAEVKLWPWVKNADWWSLTADLPGLIRLRLDEEGIAIPYPRTEIVRGRTERSDHLESYQEIPHTEE